MNNKDIKKMTLKELRKAYDEIKDGIDFERQIDICNQIIKLDPSNPLVFNNRGNAYAKLREYNKAIEDYNKAIELDPKCFEAFYNRLQRQNHQHPPITIAKIQRPKHPSTRHRFWREICRRQRAFC